MALESDQIEALVNESGSYYVYHDTSRAAFDLIVSEKRLRPATETERFGYRSAQTRPRPDAVYFAIPIPRPKGRFSSRWVKTRPFRVPFKNVALDRFLIDEDRVCDWVSGWDADGAPDFSAELKAMPKDLCEFEKGFDAFETSRGEWLDALEVDTADNVFASASRGTLAVRGSVTDAIEVNLDHAFARGCAALQQACPGGSDWLPL